MSDTMSRSLLRTAGFSLIYVVATYAGRLTVMDATNLSLVWPAAGVLAVWFVTQRLSRWRWADVLALILVTLTINLATGSGPNLACVFVGANLAQAYVFSGLFGHWLPGLWVPGGKPLTKLAELWRFFAAAIASTIVGTGIGVTGLSLVENHFAAESAFVWLARNTASILVIGVLTGRLHHRSPCQAGSSWRALGTARRLEYVAILCCSAVAYLVVYGLTNGLPLAFTLIALTVWAGLRTRTTFVIFHDLVFGTVAILFTLHGTGPFAAIQSHPLRAIVAQLFVSTVAAVGMVLALGRDEREELLVRLRDSERDAVEQARTLTGILDSMNEGLAVVDETGKMRMSNPAAARLLGMPATNPTVKKSEYYGLFRLDGTPLPDEEMVYLRVLAGDREPVDLLIRNAHVPEGRIVSISGTELPPTSDGVREAVIMFHDVTADRRHRDELASFAGVVAHDLLNPLTTIEGWSEALADDFSPGDPATASLDRIQRAAARMRSLINGLLAYTTARDASLSPTAVRLDEIVRDIATGRLDHAESTGAPMPRFDLGDLAVVDADPVLTRQLLENLIGNAIKYTAPGIASHITVRSTVTEDGFARISVDDNGIGIPPGQHEAIFQNFHRAHVNAGYAGTGLGLAICKRIVERHGGTITATGNPAGDGSRMTFTLPTVR